MGKFLRYALFLSLMFFLAACSGVQFPDSPSWKEVSIPDIKRVAGKWKGVTWAEPRRPRQDDWVEVTITEDGQFEFASYRVIGAWLGSGKLILEKGKLVTESKPDSGSAMFTLYESNGKHMLKAQGTTKTGIGQTAELNPAKK